MSSVGDWISPEGISLITTQNDPFDVIFGDDSNPGQVMIETPLGNPSITTADEGVYTCAIPNNSGEIEYLHVGIYLLGSSGECMGVFFILFLEVLTMVWNFLAGSPLVSSLSVVPSGNSSTLTLKCSSMISPASTVILMKDGNVVAEARYSMYQIVRDGALAAYDSYFSIYDVPEELIGAYSCRVLNSAGSSNSEVLTIQGLRALHCYFLPMH